MIYKYTLHGFQEKYPNEYREMIKDLSRALVSYPDSYWKTKDVIVYSSLEEYAKYELLKGCYKEHQLEDMYGKPNLLEFINLEALGKELIGNYLEDETWSNGKIVVSLQ